MSSTCRTCDGRKVFSVRRTGSRKVSWVRCPACNSTLPEAQRKADALHRLRQCGKLYADDRAKYVENFRVAIRGAVNAKCKTDDIRRVLRIRGISYDEARKIYSGQDTLT